MCRRILIVDDEPLILEMTAAMVEDMGCNVVTAVSGAEALEKIVAERIDVLITDINMPGMNGYDLANQAKGVCKELRVIVMSGHDIIHRGYPLIRKPFSQSDLALTMQLSASRGWFE
jgi:two-component system, cell cycle response regulator CpdR